jgi:DNA-binding NarL/FixJ family response regulator
MSVTIVVADDHLITLQGVVLGLQQNPEFNVIGYAKNGLEALRFCLQRLPQILILDLSMPELSGLQVIQRLQKTKVPTKILIMSSWDSPANVDQCLKSGALGYVFKSSPLQVLHDAVKTILSGERYLDPSLEMMMDNLKMLQSPVYETASNVISDQIKLTQREVEILYLLSSGSGKTSELAYTLAISTFTVNNHIKSIYAKLNVKTRMEAVQQARKLGLLGANE